MSVRLILYSALLLPLLVACGSQAQAPPSPETQIAAAVQAAPAPMRDAATVLGYNQNLELTTLREGEGKLVCVADDPSEDKFHASCYHEALEPFMKRGRELRQEGYSRAEVDSIRRAEIDDGTLSYPDRPTALYNLSGPADAYDADADSLRNASAPAPPGPPYTWIETSSTNIRTSPDLSIHSCLRTS